MTSSHKDPFQAEDQFLGIFTPDGARTAATASDTAMYTTPLMTTSTRVTVSVSPHSQSPAPAPLQGDRLPEREAFLRLEVAPEDVAAATFLSTAQARGENGVSRAGAAAVVRSTTPRAVTHAPAQVLDWYTAAAAMPAVASADVAVTSSLSASPVPAADEEKAKASHKRHRTHAASPAVTHKDEPLVPHATGHITTPKPATAVRAVSPSSHTVRPAVVTEVCSTAVSAPPIAARAESEDEAPVLLQVRQRQEVEARRLANAQTAAAKKAAQKSKKGGKGEGEAQEAEEAYAHAANKRHRRHHAHTHECDDDAASGSSTPSTSALPDYDPEEGDALLHQARIRQMHGRHGGRRDSTGEDSAADAAVLAAEALLPGEDAYVRLPYAFQQGPIPYWLQRTSELLFTQNTLGGSAAGSGELPVDTVLRQLRADMQEAQQLLQEVSFQKDEKPLRTRPALTQEQYDGHQNPYALRGTDSGHEAAEEEEVAHESADKEEEMDSHARSVHSGDTVEVFVTAGQSVSEKESAAPHTADAKKKEKKPRRAEMRHALPLLDQSTEEADRALPMLAQQIPLWRYRGAAQTALTELIDLLRTRIAVLEKRLDDDAAVLGTLTTCTPQNPKSQGGSASDEDGEDARRAVPWRVDALSLPQQFGALGGPASDGVDGRQAMNLPPAVEHAYATTMASTLMSDLFCDPACSAFTDRSVRVGDAFHAHTPAIHARYLVDEAARPVYDPARTLRDASPLPKGNNDEWLLDLARGTGAGAHASTGGGASLADARQSYSVHIDYLRFHPAKSYTDVEKVLLGRPTAGVPPTSHDAPTTSHAAAGGVSLLNNNNGNGSFASSLSTDLDRNMQPLAAAQPLTASVSWLLVQALAVSAATRQSAIPFSLESFFVAHLLHQYEHYRLLVLNLHADMKSRHFYWEQITQLEAVKHKLVRGESDKAVLVEDIEPLLQKLWTLYETATRWERHHVRRMTEMWNMVLIVRGQPPLPQEPEGSRHGRRHSRHQDGGSGVDGAEGADRRPQHGGRGGEGSVTSGIGASSSASSWPWSTSGPLHQHEAEQERHAGHTRYTTIDSPGVFASSSDASSRSDFTPPRPAHLEAGAAGHDEETSTPPAGGAPPFPYTSTALFDSPTPWRQSAGGRPALARIPAEDSFLFSTGHDDTQHQAADAVGGGDRSGAGTTGARAFRFYLVPRASPHASSSPLSRPITYIPNTEDLLDFIPVLEGVDTTAQENRLLAPSSAPVDNIAAHDACEESVHTASSAPHDPHHALGHLRFFQVAVFVRSNAAMPPQYVGSTMPRPLTTTNTLFFNETFEMRALHEPQEVLLHVLPVSTHPARQRRVLATVRVLPTLARRYRLFPLESPVSFVFHGQLIARVDQADDRGSTARTPVGGVLAASTTWTSWRGLTLEEVEHVFLSRRADPLDPAHAPVLRQLRNYYAEMERNRREARLTEAQSRRTGKAQSRRARRMAVSVPPPTSSSGARTTEHEETQGRISREPGGGQRRSVSEQRLSAGAGPLLGLARTNSLANLTALRGARRREKSRSRRGDDDDNSYGDDLSGVRRRRHGARHRLGVEDEQTDAEYDRNRLACLQKRWLVASEKAAIDGELEARLYRYPIPLSHGDARELVKFIEREMALEASARRRTYRNLDLDEAAYHAGPSSTSGLALSPLPKAVKLRLWQRRLEMSKLMRKAPRDVSDVEKLAGVVTLPKFTLRMVALKPPRSRLNPERKERPKTADIDRETFTKKSRLVFHIMKAMNLPERADGSPLEPFVEVSFVHETAYSRCELGTSPSWFQTLELAFEPPGLDEATLDMIDDDLCIAIYDKVEVPMLSTAHGVGVVAHETHYRTERRLLGTLRIPFYSLHKAESARMEGVYPLRVPRWVLGYRPASAEVSRTAATRQDGREGGAEGAAAALRDQYGSDVQDNPFASQQQAADSSVPAGAGRAGQVAFTGTSDSVMNELHSETATIQLYLSLWPPLQREKTIKVSDATLTRRVQQVNVSDGLRVLHDAALRWRKTAIRKIKSIAAMNPLASDREIEPFVFCSTGDMMLVCRYLLPHGGPPPTSVTNIYEAIRFVSLLPFVTDVMTWGDKDVWSTNAELLAERAGDYEELALLLAHLLRHLAPARPTYVVVGAGEIFEQTIMVLHSLAPQQWVLIDPRTGRLSAVEKPYATVFKDVHFVISHNQLWANLQLSGLPHRMNWDFNRPQYWLPCFTIPGGADAPSADAQVLYAREQFDAVLSPIQRVHLDFTAPDPARATEIGMALRAALHKSLTAWRHQVVPTYHRGVERVLTELLTVAEQECCRSASVHDPAVTVLAEKSLQEWFGEPISLSSGAAARRVRVPTESAGAASHETRDVSTGRRQERSCLHLVGSPAMSSYNPNDPQFHHLIQQVFETAVHEIGTDDVSFAIGVHVKSYTADVFAMWAFVAAIYRGVHVVHVGGDDNA